MVKVKTIDKVKLWSNRLFSCLSFTILMTSVGLGSTIAPYASIPAGLGLVVSFLLKNGPKTWAEIKTYLNDELNDPEKVTELMSEIQSKVHTASFVEQTTEHNEPIEEQRTPSDRAETTREVKVFFNQKTGKIEYGFQK